jgi:hypothetical protein
MRFHLPAVLVLFLTLLVGPVQAQSPVERCAQFVGSASSNATMDCRTKLMATASRYRTDQSTVIDTLISGAKRLRKAGMSTSILEIMGVTGLTGVVRNGRSFGTMLNLYIEHRIGDGLSHEKAIEAMQPS